MTTDRQRFHPESRVIPRSLDWFDSVPSDHNSGQSAAEPFEAACAFSKSLPKDLVLLAADVVSPFFLCEEEEPISEGLIPTLFVSY